MKDRSSVESAAFSVNEAARFLGVSQTTVRSEIFLERIPSFRIGRRVLIPRKYLEEMIQNGASRGKADA